MITEVVPGGELFDYVAQKDHLCEDEARGIMRQLFAATDYMHRMGIVHRDLKVTLLFFFLVAIQSCVSFDFPPKTDSLSSSIFLFHSSFFRWKTFCWRATGRSKSSIWDWETFSISRDSAC
jgi:serine/threonine protein kinase